MKKRYIISFVVAIIILSVLFLWNVGAGSVDISTSDLFAILAGSGKDETFSQIVWKIRLPRILAAILLGGALSVSGFLLQSFFQNPIAGPYVLGISSGAKLVVALTMIFLLEKGIMISSFGMVMAAFVGSMLAMGFVLLISFRVSKMSLLVVCGIMIGYICSAITDFCVTFASDSNIVNLHNWSMGSFSGMTWENIKMIVVIVGAAVLVTFCLAKPIGAYQMGEAYARNIGVNVKVLRVTMILLSSLLSACVTAFAGPISFVGIDGARRGRYGGGRRAGCADADGCCARQRSRCGLSEDARKALQMHSARWLCRQRIPARRRAGRAQLSAA